MKHFITFPLEKLDHQDLDARINIIGLQINLCSIGGKSSIENLLEENKPEVKKESVVKFRQKSPKKLDCRECSDFDAKNRLTET